MYLVAPPSEEPIRFPTASFVSVATALVAVFALGLYSDPFLAFARLAVSTMVK